MANVSVLPENSDSGNASDRTTGYSLFNEDAPFHLQMYWVPCEIILSLLTIFAVYIFVCILRNAMVKKTSPGRDMTGKKGKYLHQLTIVASGLAVLRLASDHTVAFLGTRSDEHCFTTVAISTVFYALSILSVYVFLWVRQSIFYSNPILSKVLNKGVTIVSWSTLVAMCVSCLSLTVLYNVREVTGWVYKATRYGCFDISVTEVVEVVPALTVAVTIYFQLSLLALFLYPLLSRSTQRYRSAGKNAATEKQTQHPSSMSNTDDNLTDGERTTSHSAHSPRNILKPEQEGSDSVKLSDSLSNEGNGAKDTDQLRGLPICSDEVDADKQGAFKNKRPSIFSTTRIFKASGLFYKRTPSKLGTVPNSPTAKRSRVMASSSKIESDNPPKERKISGASGKSDSSKRLRRRAKRTQQGRRLMSYLKKSFYLMMVCVISDIIAVIVQEVAEVPELVYLVVFDLNLMINLICIILSFRDWDLIIFPLCARVSSRANSISLESSKGNAKPNGLARKLPDMSVIGTGNGYKHPPELSSPSSMQYHKNVLSSDRAGSFSNGVCRLPKFTPLNGNGDRGHDLHGKT